MRNVRLSPAAVVATLALAAGLSCSRPAQPPSTTTAEKKAPAASTPSATTPSSATPAAGMASMSAQAAAGTVATAEIAALGGSGVTGKVTFTVIEPDASMRTTAGAMPGATVRVQADITGLTPGMHGIHVHEWGDCSAPDGTSAGGHFNPHGMPHGDRMAAQKHPGDFGNIEADASGHATLDYCCIDAPLTSAADGILGHAVIIHGQADDLTTQPSGNSGPRLGCGLVKLSGQDTPPVLPPGAAGQ
jgi:Cu-Zn family superoxide dismutase